ncbi:hypothetical protein QR680_005415 [Steinernema hermaphroditum]|uniref:Secreted protein n=1 Tax=Steinernema hermaphroditum TaxID=289476 RepID=A0AA39HRY7_9BILA|nr:hypothetical protein QR680_005415 [Steinernema hermaphroditum]
MSECVWLLLLRFSASDDHPEACPRMDLLACLAWNDLDFYRSHSPTGIGAPAKMTRDIGIRFPNLPGSNLFSSNTVRASRGSDNASGATAANAVATTLQSSNSTNSANAAFSALPTLTGPPTTAAPPHSSAPSSS